MNDLNKDITYRFEHFFELSPDLLCIAGYDGYFKRINPSVSKLLGFTNEELFSKPISEFIHSEDREITAKVRQELLKSTPLLNFENRYITKSGEIVWLHWTSMPIESDEVVFAIAKNITHKKKLEEERNTLLANFTRHNKELKHLTYRTSHDLRAPVNNLLSVFGQMDMTKIEDQETLQFVEILRLASETLKQTLNDYVDLLCEKDGQDSKIEELDLNVVLSHVLYSINSIIVNSGTSIQINFSELEKVKFNKEYLESIFLNLITNSIKYARPGVTPMISVYSKKVNGLSQLIIEDNGLGFDMKKVENKIFGLHQKFHNHVDSKGIGLYLVHTHVTNLGGSIAVESQVNKGSIFTITFKDRS